MTASLRSLSILLLGDTNRAEFADARRSLEDWGDVACFRDADAAAAALTDGSIVPGVIIVAQAFPGQFSHGAVDRLRRLSPLTPVIGLMGSWCEGEMRTGSPWPGAVRTYWHQWAARCDRELRRLSENMAGPWTLPATSTEEERLLADIAETAPPHHGLVVISSRSREMADWLAAACRSRGFATVWQRTAITTAVQGATAAVFDGTDGSGNEWAELARTVTMLHPTPVIALLAFPRIEDRRRALSAGAAAIISKPLLVEDLFWQLDAVEARQGRVTKSK